MAKDSGEAVEEKGVEKAYCNQSCNVDVEQRELQEQEEMWESQSSLGNT